MASLFKRDGKGPWRIAYADWDPKTGRKRRREHSTQQGDKSIAAQEAARLEAEARQHKQEADDLTELRRRGLSDPVAERLADHSLTPLTTHLEAYRAVLEGKGDTADHIATTVSACRAIIAACGFVFPSDLDPVAVSRWVTGQRKPPKATGDGKERKAPAPRTINRKLGALKSFSRWLWETERIRTDPMVQVHKLNGQTDRRRRRRAFTEDEIGRLLAAAEHGPDVMGMAGHDRAMLYRIALGTGLRANELRTLTPQSFYLSKLDGAKVVVEAAYSKHRRRDVLPIRRDLAEAVAAFIEGKSPAEPLFPTMPPRPAKMLLVDLANARPWIPETDTKGRILDFHCTRVTYITRLARAGVSPAVAKTLARHSTITLTMDVYTDIAEGDERAALSKLPALPKVAVIGAETPRATGTDG